MTDLRIEFFDVVILTHQAPIGGLAAHSARTHGIGCSCEHHDWLNLALKLGESATEASGSEYRWGVRLER